eukprot:gb/GECG01000394.1/.p1 GENE.gb/GECG01000394.1/~~gb/GECG01000394.1/.p1  ORF type:complete len:449 (+),score=54.31 gb/GECG01000394.1/:1-1347(+)
MNSNREATTVIHGSVFQRSVNLRIGISNGMTSLRDFSLPKVSKLVCFKPIGHSSFNAAAPTGSTLSFAELMQVATVPCIIIFLESVNSVIGPSSAPVSILSWFRSCTCTMAASSERGRLVIVGPSSAGKKTLAKGLLQVNKRDASAGAGNPSAKLDEVCKYPLTLDTKYYSADIDVEVFPASWFWDVNEETRLQTRNELLTKLEGAEGVLLVLEYETFSESCNVLEKGTDGLPATQNTLEVEMCRWNRLLDDMEETPSLKLCVGSKFAVDNTANSELPPTPKWCIEQGWEFVPADLTQPMLTVESRDKQGVARIHEALEAVMWKGMQMRTHPLPSPNRGSLASAGQGNSGFSIQEDNFMRSEDNDPFLEVEEEDQMLQKLMHDINSAREMSQDIDRDNEEERRANQDRAAQIAMRLMRMMGMDENDDEEAQDTGDNEQSENLGNGYTQ